MGGSLAGKILTSRRRNPQRRDGTREERLEKAEKLLQDFSGHTPTKILRIDDRPIKQGFAIGDLDGVLYSTVRDGKRERYVHEFRKKSRPLLATSHDGTQLRILGGEFEFTEAGIEDR